MQSTQIYEKLTDIFQQVFDDDSIVVRPELTASDVDELFRTEREANQNVA